MNTCCRLVVCLAAALSFVHAVSAQTAEPDRIGVRVLDHRGRPAAGLPLVIGRLSAVGKAVDFSPLQGQRAVTDADGRAVFPAPATRAGWFSLHLQADIVAEPPLRIPLEQ